MSEDWKPTDPEFIADPQPYYEKIRQEGPIIRANSGDYVLLDYDVCKSALLNPFCKTGLQAEKLQKIAEYSGKNQLELETISELMKGMLIQMNEPSHPILRSKLATAWPSSNYIKSLSKKIINSELSALPKSFDAVHDLCKRIPLYIISDILGFPPEIAFDYASDGLKVVQSLDPYFSYRNLLEIQKSSERLVSFITSTITSSEFNPTPLANAILEVGREHDELNDASIFAFLFIAGYETTTTLLATCLHELIKNPLLAKEVESNGANSFVKEMLRIHSPVQITGRSTTQKITLGTKEIPEGSVLTICVGSANTDPKRFNNPLKVDWDREKHDHLSFGYGMHHCLGKQLAEIEAVVFTEAILPLVPKLHLESEPVFENKFAVRSFKSMYISIQ